MEASVRDLFVAHYRRLVSRLLAAVDATSAHERFGVSCSAEADGITPAQELSEGQYEVRRGDGWLRMPPGPRPTTDPSYLRLDGG